MTHRWRELAISIESLSGNTNFSDINLSRQLFGEHHSNLKKIADALDLTINARGNTVFIEGDSISANLAQNILKQLYDLSG